MQPISYLYKSHPESEKEIQRELTHVRV